MSVPGRRLRRPAGSPTIGFLLIRSHGLEYLLESHDVRRRQTPVGGDAISGDTIDALLLGSVGTGIE